MSDLEDGFLPILANIYVLGKYTPLSTNRANIKEDTDNYMYIPPLGLLISGTIFLLGVFTNVLTTFLPWTADTLTPFRLNKM